MNDHADTLRFVKNELRLKCRNLGEDCEVCAKHDEALDAAIAALEAGRSGEAVAWSLPVFICDGMGREIGADETDVRWGSECPDPDEGWSPLYGSPQFPAIVPAAKYLTDRGAEATSEWRDGWDACAQYHTAATPQQPTGRSGEADGLLRDWGLDPERFRSEGGHLNPGKIRAALLHPDDYEGLCLSGGWSYFKPPFRVVERSETIYVEDSGCMSVMLQWPQHPVEETDLAERETWRLGEAFVNAANAAAPQQPPPGESKATRAGPDSVGVTDAMVEQAIRAFWPPYDERRRLGGSSQPGCFSVGMRAALEAALSHQQPAPPVKADTYNAVSDAMVGRFLAWRLPEDFHPDAGIFWQAPTSPHAEWPTGTNLLHAGQARAMLEHVIGQQPAPSVAEAAYTKATDPPHTIGSVEHPDALPDGTFSKSTMKRRELLIQGETSSKLVDADSGEGLPIIAWLAEGEGFREVIHADDLYARTETGELPPIAKWTPLGDCAAIEARRLTTTGQRAE